MYDGRWVIRVHLDNFFIFEKFCRETRLNELLIFEQFEFKILFNPLKTLLFKYAKKLSKVNKMCILTQYNCCPNTSLLS